MANLSIPLGYKCRFEPEDHELITCLSCKANGEPLPSEGVIKEIDLYSMNDPGELFQGSQEKIVYVFTKVKKVAENGKIVNRKVTGNGRWKRADRRHPIYDKEGCLVGDKKNFVFVSEMITEHGYNMTEFVLDKGSLSAAKFKDYVLCKIKTKVKKGTSAQEEDTRSSKTEIEEEHNAAIKEEFNSSSTLELFESDARENTGLQEATASTTALDNAMISSEFFEASDDWINNMFPEFAQD